MGDSATTTNQQREYLKSVYSGAAFAKKVNLMAPDQVYAMYVRVSRANNFQNKR